MNRPLLVTALLCLSACGEWVSNTRVRGGDGLAYQLIECHHMSDCMYRANEVCPQGYADSYEGKRPKTMMVRCKSKLGEGW